MWPLAAHFDPYKVEQETHQEMRYPNVTSLYFATSLAFNAPTDGFPWEHLRKILHGSQRMAKVQNGDNITESYNPLSRAHERYRR